MDERNLKAAIQEFIPDEQEVQRQIEAEWERMYERGETIREGDGAQKACDRWHRDYGDALRAIFRHHGRS